MTIIEPKKFKSQYKRYLIPILGLIFAGAAASIYFYSDIVELKDNVQNQEKTLQQLEVKNAELKNQLYTILDANKLKESAGTLGLILERDPNYLETKTITRAN